MSRPTVEQVRIAQEAIQAILKIALEQDTNVILENPENGKQVHIISRNGQLWIDGQKVG